MWVKTENSHVPGTVVQQASTPHLTSYPHPTPNGQMRRNSINLQVKQEADTALLENTRLPMRYLVELSPEASQVITPPDRLRF